METTLTTLIGMSCCEFEYHLTLYYQLLTHTETILEGGYFSLMS